MAQFKEADRVFIPATNERGEITEVFPLAEGPWAEQYYGVNLDGTPEDYEVTLQEQALHAEPDEEQEPAT